MTYILAADELTVRTYSSRTKKSPNRRLAKSTTPSTVKQESNTDVESQPSSVQPSTMRTLIFPGPESVRPVFCCTSVLPKNPNYACKLGTTTSILQWGRLYNFLDYFADYSLGNCVPVVEDLTWPARAEYLVKVLRYHSEEAPKSPPTSSYRKKRRFLLRSSRRGKEEEKEVAQVVKWQQAAPGRYFIEMKHEKRKRWPDHAFDEVLVTEEVSGIPECFEKVEEVTMEAVCPVHSGAKWVCEFWAKKERAS